MRKLRLLTLAAASMMAGASAAQAQTTVDDVRRELQQMRHDYDAELKRMRQEYEGRIQQLESRVRAAEARAGSPTGAQAQASPPVPSQEAPSPPAPAQAPSESVQPGRAPPPPLQAGRAPAPQMITPAQQPAPPPSSASPPSAPAAPAAAPADTTAASATGGLMSTPGRAPVQSVRGSTGPAPGATSGNSFNPAIGLVLDGRFAAFERDPATYTIPAIQFPQEAGLGPRSFGIGESELSVSANIDDKLFGQFIMSIDGQNTVSVEEAYFDTLSLPWGFSFRGGRFFSNIGYLNSVHRHAWDFADQALPYRAFLSNQYDDDGIQLRWLAPTNFLLEVGGELFRGDAYPFSGPNAVIGSGSAFVHVGDDITPNMSYRLGGSFLRGSSIARTTDFGATVFSGTTTVTGLDAVFKWAPTGNAAEEQLKLQAEVLFREDNGNMNGLGFYSPAWGWYAQLVYRFLPSWEVGLRADSVLINNYGPAVADGVTLQGWGVPRDRQTIALTYYTSEFGRFRAQYDRDVSSGFLDNQFLLQYTVSLGAHGAHKY
jgi:hypothetical protein